MLPDLHSDEDVRAVVEAFYAGIEQDPLIGHHFAGLDMPGHLPTMVSFWSSIVFGTGAYRGRPFETHTRLQGLTRMQFDQWVARFQATVDGLFAGDRATLMKARAEQIAGVFQVKLGLWASSIPEADSTGSAHRP